MIDKKKSIIVGSFIIFILVIFVWATLKVSDRVSMMGSGYELSILLDNATGLKNKAPVELAGVQIGIVKGVELANSRLAKAVLIISDRVSLPLDSKAILRTRGFLGETYVEIIPGSADVGLIDEGGEIVSTMRTGDINSLVSQFNAIASDIKTVTSSLKTMVGVENSPVKNTIANLEQFTEILKDLTLRNEANFDRIAGNLAEVTATLKEVILQSRINIEETVDNLASVTGKINRGEGTLGRLVNDEETVEKLNEAVDNLNNTLGGFSKLEAELGYSVEYLTDSKDFKHYVSLALRPSPDKAFLFDIVADPNPYPTHIERTSEITVGGNTTTVQTHTATINTNKLMYSAQLAKKFYNLQLRGGIIESSGGVGLDYYLGPFEASFSAYDLTATKYDERPHLKAWGKLNVTKNFFISGGADDFINKTQGVDYFVGAGFRLIDEDIKSLFGMGGSFIK